MAGDSAPLRAFLPTPELKALLDGDLPKTLRDQIDDDGRHFVRLPRAEFGPLGPWVQAFQAIRLAESRLWKFYCKDSCQHLANHGEWEPLAAIARSDSTKARANAYARLDPKHVPAELVVEGLWDSSSQVRASAISLVAKVPERARPVLESKVPGLKGKAKKLAEEALKHLAPPAAPSSSLLDELIAAWAETRDPAIADAVDALGKVTPCEPLEGRTAKEKEAQWHLRVKAKDAASLTVLLELPWPTQWKDGSKRLVALKGRIDPRIATAYMSAIEHPPYDSQASIVFRRALMGDLAALADPRQVPRMEKARPALEKQLAGYLYLTDIRSAVEGESLKNAIAGLKLKPAEPWAPRVAKARELSHGSIKRERTEQDMLEHIWSAPHDDDARRVYADWLLERGDLRGELIALQLGPRSEAALKRERQLIRELEPRLLGTLDTYVRREGRVFERGFLAAAQVEWRAFVRGLNEPAWATVHTLSFPTGCYGAEIARLLSSPAGRSVRAVHSPRPDQLPLLKDFPLTELGIDVRHEIPAELDGFTKLERLALDGSQWTKGMPAFLVGSLWKRIRHFSMNTLSGLPTWLDRFEQAPWLETLTLMSSDTVVSTSPQRFRLTLERGAKATIELHPGSRDWSSAPFDELEKLLPRLQKLDIVESRSLSQWPEWAERLKAMAAKVSPRST